MILERKAADKDKLHIDNNGYSLIELIIVMAIIAVLLTTVVFSITMVFSANAKACANDIQRAITDCKVTTMGKAEAYMEIYRDTNENIYSQMFVVENGSTEAMDPEKLGPARVTVSYTLADDSTGELTAGGAKLRIAFDRASGSFTTDTCKSIEVRGGTKHYEITLTRLTGKSSLKMLP